MLSRTTRFTAWFAVLLAAAVSAEAVSLVPVRLRCEYLEDPAGIDVVRPRLSWWLESDDGADGPAKQAAFRLLVGSSIEAVRRGVGDRWDVTVDGPAGAAQRVEYAGRPLKYGDHCWWKVQTIGADGAASAWSAIGRFGIGPLEKADWEAEWIAAEEPEARRSEMVFARSFHLDSTPETAIAYVASLGYHELRINGEPVDDRVLTPHVSELSVRARYVAYPLAGRLRQGENTIEVVAAAGWADFSEYRVERCPAVRCQVDLGFGDQAAPRRIVSDADWETRFTGTTRADAWRQHHYAIERQSDSPRDATTCVIEPGVLVSAERVQPNRKQERLAPASVAPFEGGWRIDFGRQFTGMIELPLTQGAPGATVRLSVSEREEQVCSYGQEFSVVLDENGEAVFRNRFNYCCGRWLTVSPGVAEPHGARAWLVHTDYPVLTEFACSDETLNRVHEAAAWTFRCLSLGGYVVDCAHRERLGYGGDAHATTPLGLTHFGLGAFYTKWLQDWRDVQRPDGDLPHTAPTHSGGGGPAWSGFIVQAPWEVWLHYGDRRVLEENWDAIRRWMAFLESKSRGDILRRYGDKEWGFLGDWVPPGRGQSPSDRVDERSTLFFNNCYWALNLDTAAKIAQVLDDPAAAAAYRDRLEKVRAATHAEFWRADTASYANGEQPYLAFALLSGVVPEAERARVEASLASAIVDRRGGHINAGIHGHAFLLEQLTRAGRADLVALMATKRTYPSWGHMLDNGATTIWEQWDGENSRCHSSFLAVGAWFVNGLAGIRPDPAAPGYENIVIEPGVNSGVEWCHASFDSPRGRVVSDWRRQGDRVRIEVQTPPGSTATVRLPNEPTERWRRVGPGRSVFDVEHPAESAAD